MTERDLIDRYGLADIGERFRQVQTDELFSQLLADYRLLADAGLDHTVILEKMRAAMGALTASRRRALLRTMRAMRGARVRAPRTPPRS